MKSGGAVTPQPPTQAQIKCFLAQLSTCHAIAYAMAIFDLFKRK
jgi:hypothetical protein